jgi:hypothetical protein
MTTNTNTTNTANTTKPGSLYMALELGSDKWLLACATQAAEKPRFKQVPGQNLDKLREEIAKSKKRFGLPPDAAVYTCFEAGRDGFWRFAFGNKRTRKIGIVALARKLLIALWRYVKDGKLPEGAETKDWRLNVSSTARRHARVTAAQTAAASV